MTKTLTYWVRDGDRVARNDKILVINGRIKHIFLKGAQVGGQTWDLFDFCLFSLTIAAP